MILRPVTPASPCGPPITNLPVGLMKTFVALSIMSAGISGLMIFAVMSANIFSLVTSGLCWVETTIASMRSGLLPSYSTVTCDLPSGRK